MGSGLVVARCCVLVFRMLLKDLKQRTEDRGLAFGRITFFRGFRVPSGT